MMFRICGGLFMFLLGLAFFVPQVPAVLIAVLALLAGIALLGGW